MIRNWKLQVLILVIFLLTIFGCTEKQRKELKHFKSDIIGLKREVILYDANGHVIRKWRGRFKIEINGAFISFIDDNGKEVKLSGTIIVQEL